MKKSLFIISMLVLSACAGTTGAGNGLTRLENEPKNCEFLYTIDSSSSTYDIDDAYDYLEKSILDQNSFGDSYYIEKEKISENVGAVFGPKQTYKFKAKVYACNK
nr:hypothetical protein [Candidatus Enterousia merdequi]